MSQETQAGALYQPGGVGWGGEGDGRDIQEGGDTHTHIYLWLIHVEV